MKCSASLMLAIQALIVVIFGLEKVYVQAVFYAGYLHPRTTLFKVLEIGMSTTPLYFA